MQTLIPLVVDSGTQQKQEDADRCAVVRKLTSSTTLSSSPQSRRKSQKMFSSPSSSPQSSRRMPAITSGNNNKKRLSTSLLSSSLPPSVSAIPARFTIGYASDVTMPTNDVTNREEDEVKHPYYRHHQQHIVFPKITMQSRSLSRRLQYRSSSLGNIGETSLKRKGNRDNELSAFPPYFGDTRGGGGGSDEDIKKDVLYDRVKQFIVKENPGRPPLSLRYVPPKLAGEKTKLLLRPKSPQLPINTNSCPNLCLLADREQWSYNNYRPGKCRYLRCPQSPVLGPEEIFADV